MAQLNEQNFHAFIGKMLGDLGGAFSVPTTRIGFRLGLFDALNAGGPATAADLAARAGQAKLSEIIGGAGFLKVRRATEGPFNMILEARI
jgi:hypothetical protein